MAEKFDRSTYMSFIPEYLRENEDFLVFLQLAATEFDISFENIEKYTDLVNPDKVPTQFIEALGSFVDFKLVEYADDDFNRELLMRVQTIYEQRGTDHSIIMAATHGANPGWAGGDIFIPGYPIEKEKATLVVARDKVFTHSRSSHSGGNVFQDGITYLPGVIVIQLPYLTETIIEKIIEVMPAGVRFKFFMNVDIAPSDPDYTGNWGEISVHKFFQIVALTAEEKEKRDRDIDFGFTFDIGIDPDHRDSLIHSTRTRGRRLRSGRIVVSSELEYCPFLGVSMLAHSMLTKGFLNKKTEIKPVEPENPELPEYTRSSLFVRSTPSAKFSSIFRSSGGIIEKPEPTEEDTDYILSPSGERLDIIDKTGKAHITRNIQTSENVDVDVKVDYRITARRSHHTGERSWRSKLSGIITNEIDNLVRIMEIMPHDFIYYTDFVKNLRPRDYRDPFYQTNAEIYKQLDMFLHDIELKDPMFSFDRVTEIFVEFYSDDRAIFSVNTKGKRYRSGKMMLWAGYELELGGSACMLPLYAQYDVLHPYQPAYNGDKKLFKFGSDSARHNSGNKYSGELDSYRVPLDIISFNGEHLDTHDKEGIRQITRGIDFDFDVGVDCETVEREYSEHTTEIVMDTEDKAVFSSKCWGSRLRSGKITLTTEYEHENTNKDPISVAPVCTEYEFIRHQVRVVGRNIDPATGHIMVLKDGDKDTLDYSILMDCIRNYQIAAKRSENSAERSSRGKFSGALTYDNVEYAPIDSMRPHDDFYYTEDVKDRRPVDGKNPFPTPEFEFGPPGEEVLPVEPGVYLTELSIDRETSRIAMFSSNKDGKRYRSGPMLTSASYYREKEGIASSLLLDTMYDSLGSNDILSPSGEHLDVEDKSNMFGVLRDITTDNAVSVDCAITYIKAAVRSESSAKRSGKTCFSGFGARNEDVGPEPPVEEKEDLITELVIDENQNKIVFSKTEHDKGLHSGKQLINIEFSEDSDSSVSMLTFKAQYDKDGLDVRSLTGECLDSSDKSTVHQIITDMGYDHDVALDIQIDKAIAAIRSSSSSNRSGRGKFSGIMVRNSDLDNIRENIMELEVQRDISNTAVFSHNTDKKNRSGSLLESSEFSLDSIDEVSMIPLMKQYKADSGIVTPSGEHVGTVSNDIGDTLDVGIEYITGTEYAALRSCSNAARSGSFKFSGKVRKDILTELDMQSDTRDKLIFSSPVIGNRLRSGELTITTSFEMDSDSSVSMLNGLIQNESVSVSDITSLTGEHLDTSDKSGASQIMRDISSNDVDVTVDSQLDRDIKFTHSSDVVRSGQGKHSGVLVKNTDLESSVTMTTEEVELLIDDELEYTRVFDSHSKVPNRSGRVLLSSEREFDSSDIASMLPLTSQYTIDSTEVLPSGEHVGVITNDINTNQDVVIERVTCVDGIAIRGEASSVRSGRSGLSGVIVKNTDLDSSATLVTKDIELQIERELNDTKVFNKSSDTPNRSGKIMVSAEYEG